MKRYCRICNDETKCVDGYCLECGESTKKPDEKVFDEFEEDDDFTIKDELELEEL